MMRTTYEGEYLTSWMESAPPDTNDDGFCGMCVRKDAPDVLVIRHRRNGTQESVFTACAECRRALLAHFANHDSKEI